MNTDSNSSGLQFFSIIPARGGSKGILRKNLQKIAGKSLLQRAIEGALACKAIARVIVSTEDPEIQREALKLGAEAPFLRPIEYAHDTSGDREVFAHALQWLDLNEKVKPDYLLNIRCTAPFRGIEDICNVIEKCRSQKFDSVRTVTRAIGTHHPYWMVTENNGFAHSVIDGKNADNFPRRQLLPAIYRFNGVVDALRSDLILGSEKSMWGQRMGLVEVPDIRAIDIDTKLDLDFAEFVAEKMGL